jgi:hypothetical protein
VLPPLAGFCVCGVKWPLVGVLGGRDAAGVAGDIDEAALVARSFLARFVAILDGADFPTGLMGD